MYPNVHRRSKSSSSSASNHDMLVALPPSYFEARDQRQPLASFQASSPTAHSVQTAIHAINRHRANAGEDIQRQVDHRNPVIQDVFFGQFDKQVLEVVGSPTAHHLANIVADEVLGVFEDQDWMNPNLRFPSVSPSSADGTLLAVHQSGRTTAEPAAQEDIVSQPQIMTDVAEGNSTCQPAVPLELACSRAISDHAGEISTSEAAKIEEIARPQGLADLDDENVCREEDTPLDDAPPRGIDLEAVTFEDSLSLARQGFEGTMRFRSAEEARRGMERRGEVEFDPTLPTTAEHRLVMAALLVRAVQDTSSEGESKAVQDFRKGKWPSEAIEAVCWELLEKMILRHENGASLTLEHAKKPTGSFWERFSEMLAALKGSKAICKHLLDAPYIYTVVDDPAAALRRVMANKRVNDRKSNIILAGTRAMAEGSSPNDQLPTPEATTGGGGEGGGGTKRPAPGPVKGRPPAKKPKG